MNKTTKKSIESTELMEQPNINHAYLDKYGNEDFLKVRRELYKNPAIKDGVKGMAKRKKQD